MTLVINKNLKQQNSATPSKSTKRNRAILPLFITNKTSSIRSHLLPSKTKPSPENPAGLNRRKEKAAGNLYRLQVLPLLPIFLPICQRGCHPGANRGRDSRPCERHRIRSKLRGTIPQLRALAVQLYHSVC
ncbi:unnamed protein product [Vicia faba]|uniref:Uncharacterized protein n=1 Tax=Vicia faba TaxID=3906 RepID=A0AAV1AUG4_VICFA|nr:unnamed protein product [Vicia faba]